MCRELQRLDHYLCDDLGAQQVHAEMRDLRLIEQAAVGVRGKRRRWGVHGGAG
jgi:hypothetical protein